MTNHPNRGRSRIVTLIRHHSGFINVADDYRIAEPGEEPDETDNEVAETYYLPPGFSVRESQAVGLQVYDALGNHYEIIQHRQAMRPQLAGIGRAMPVLEPAPAGGDAA